jgi:hypothetical protein
MLVTFFVTVGKRRLRYTQAIESLFMRNDVEINQQSGGMH